MLQRPTSPTPFFGVLREHECPRCHRPVELPLGQLCSTCRREIDRRAGRIARIVAGATTVVVGGYVLLRTPGAPQARTVGVVGVVLWYVLTYVIAKRVLREYLP
ncbi:MAG: hypothetical protein PVF27_03490 [Gemmatimonadales bacterium]|jgi:hypothetical protein